CRTRSTASRGFIPYALETRCASFFFFFQAEDGIRDFHVTGVQTCALPISLPALGDDADRIGNAAHDADALGHALDPRGRQRQARSEERRVGKECRGGGWPCQ